MTTWDLQRERRDLELKIQFGEKAYVMGVEGASSAIAARTLRDIRVMKERLAEVDRLLGLRKEVRETTADSEVAPLTEAEVMEAINHRASERPEAKP